MKKYSKYEIAKTLYERADRVHGTLIAQETELEEGGLSEEERDIVSANIEDLSDWERCLRDVAFEILNGDLLK